MKRSSIVITVNILLVLFNKAGAKKENAPTTSIPIPRLYFSSAVLQCSTDSPEFYYETEGFPNLSSLFDEGKVFFGILMDKLETSVSDPTEKENLEKEWKDLVEVVENSYELAAQRIEDSWVKIIDDFDTKPLPWELSWRKGILVEQFLRLHYEYQILEAVLKSGVKELIGSLRMQLVEVLKKLENKVVKQGEPIESEPKILKSLEKNLKELEPNFMGKLLTAIVQKAMFKKNKKAAIPAISTYMSETVEKMTLVVEAYKGRGDEFPRFWAEMTQIMKKEGTRKPMSIPDMLIIYGDEDLVIYNVISLLVKPLE